MIRPAASLLLVTTLSLTGGCVTETVARRPASSAATRAPDAPPAPAPSPAAGPTAVARPATDTTTIRSEVKVAIRPLGSIPFDGQVLPLVSPDGRYLATQIGEAPAWPALLARPGARLPQDTSVEVYDLTASPPRVVAWSRALPTGILLGRSSTTQEFLIEEPQPDGSRWIAAVGWDDGEVRWLVQGADSNAHAVCLTRDGPADRIVFTRRAPGDPVGRLVVLADAMETEITPPEGVAELMAAIAGDDSPALYAFELGAEGLDLVARPMARGGQTGPIAARRQIAPRDAADAMLLTYQALSPVQPWSAPPNRRSGVESERTPPGLLFHHPVSGRMSVFDPRDATISPLEPRSIGGAWALDPLGWSVFVSAPDGLVHQRVVRDDETGRLRALPSSRVLKDPFVPYATSSPERPFVLIGPAREPKRLSVVLMDVVRDEPPPAQ